MKTKEHATPNVSKVASAGGDLNYAIRRYVRAYTALHGRQTAVDHFGVSRHTLSRFLKRGHSGRSLPKAVLDNVGDGVGDVEAATMRLIASAQVKNAAVQKPGKILTPGGKLAPSMRTLPQGPEDALLLLCTTPLTTVRELARLGRVPHPPCGTGWGSCRKWAWWTSYPTTLESCDRTSSAATSPRKRV